jgi:hypothetical protein
MTITAKELRKQLSPDVAALSAKALAELDGRNVDPVTLENNAGALGVEVANPLAARFEALWQRWEGPELTKEYRFHPHRRWRLDYYHAPTRTGIELHGGVWSEGRHVRGNGFLGDLDKMNAAQMQGLVVLQLGTGQVDHQHVTEIIDYIRREMVAIQGK